LTDNLWVHKHHHRETMRKSNISMTYHEIMYYLLLLTVWHCSMYRTWKQLTAIVHEDNVHFSFVDITSLDWFEIIVAKPRLMRSACGAKLVPSVSQRLRNLRDAVRRVSRSFGLSRGPQRVILCPSRDPLIPRKLCHRLCCTTLSEWIFLFILGTHKTLYNVHNI